MTKEHIGYWINTVNEDFEVFNLPDEINSTAIDLRVN